jgi:hypothetical protein
MMFVVSLIEFSKHVQNEISAKVMPKPQNFTADFADRTDRRNYDPPKTPNYAERTTGPRSEVSVVRIFSVPRRDVTLTRAMGIENRGSVLTFDTVGWSAWVLGMTRQLRIQYAGAKSTWQDNRRHIISK